jgi:hypothetical protein
MIVAAILSSQSFAQQSNAKSDSLKPYLKCEFDDGLYIKETTPRGASSQNFREVKMGDQTKKISVIDGYRIMFAYPGAHYFFANVKLEGSDPNAYAQDKANLIDMLKYYAATEKPKMIFRDRTSINGYDSYGLDREVMDFGGVIGNHIIFLDNEHLVITVYFLNQGREARRFHTLDEYYGLRDRFLDHYSKCIKAVSH